MAQRGFTLLEMLVALTILGLLLVALHQGIRTGTSLWTWQNRRVSDIEEQDSATWAIRSILTRVPIQPGIENAPAAIGFSGQSDQISWVGELPTGLGFSRLADITLHLKGDHVVISWIPHRHEVSAIKPGPTETDLIGHVTSLGFGYWGRVNPNSAPGWQSQWNGPLLPRLIRVRLTFAPGDNRRWPDLIIEPSLWKLAGSSP